MNVLSSKQKKKVVAMNQQGPCQPSKIPALPEKIKKNKLFQQIQLKIIFKEKSSDKSGNGEFLYKDGVIY